MKIWPLITVVLLITAALFVRHNLAMNTFIDECTQRTAQQGIFVQALRAQDAELCTALDGALQQRCAAYIANEPTLCPVADADCTAIASRNESICAEPICKALASRDPSHCQELPDPTYCSNLATFNAEAFVPNKEACRNAANLPWISPTLI